MTPLLSCKREICTSMCGGGFEQTLESLCETDGTSSMGRVRVPTYYMFPLWGQYGHWIENCSKLVPVCTEQKSWIMMKDKQMDNE